MLVWVITTSAGLDGANREQYIYLFPLIRMVWTAYHFTVVHEVFSGIIGLIISTRFSPVDIRKV